LHLRSLLNVQSNRYTNAENLILLGEVDCKKFLTRAENLGEEDPHYFDKLGDLVKEIDAVVAGVVERIVSLGKVPLL
jgi:formiminoglutamase